MNVAEIAARAWIHGARHVTQQMDYYLCRGLSKPDKVEIALTSRCNARCLMCHFWKTTPGQRDELSAEQWIEVIDELHDWLGHFFLSLSGGEVFVKKGIFELLSHAVAHGISVRILSNGLVFESDASIQRLLDTGLNAINLSLDGMDPTLHDRLRGRPGLHNIVLHAIRRIKAQKPHITVTAVCIVMGDTIAQLPAFVRWAHKKGIDRVLFQPVGPTFGSPEACNPRWYLHNEYFVRDLKLLDSAIDEVIAIKRQSGIVGNSFDNLGKIKLYFRDPTLLQIKRSRCILGQSNLLIDDCGDLAFCYKLKKKIGNAADGAIRETWRSALSNKVRKEIRRCRLPCMALCYRSFALREKVALFLRYASSGKL